MTKVAWVWLRSIVSFISFTPLLLASGGGAVQERAEAVQAAFGRQPLPAYPVRGGGQRPGDELIGADPPGLRRADDAGLLQDAQVLDHRRQRHVERPGQLADRRRTAGQPLDHGPPAAVAQCAEHPVELRILRHAPKY